MINVRFESEALEPDTFKILKFDREEELSHLFRFELQLVSRDPDIDFKAVLESRAVLEITNHGEPRYIRRSITE